MAFDLTSFTLCPLLEAFNRCRKKDLIEIADFFHTDISRDASTQVIKEELFRELVKTGVLLSDKEAVVGMKLEAVAKAAVLDFDLNT